MPTVDDKHSSFLPWIDVIDRARAVDQMGDKTASTRLTLSERNEEDKSKGGSYASLFFHESDRCEFESQTKKRKIRTTRRIGISIICVFSPFLSQTAPHTVMAGNGGLPPLRTARAGIADVHGASIGWTVHASRGRIRTHAKIYRGSFIRKKSDHPKKRARMPQENAFHCCCCRRRNAWARKKKKRKPFFRFVRARRWRQWAVVFFFLGALWDNPDLSRMRY